MSSEILIIQTGGTIDKDYPRRSCRYAFEITDSAADRILKRLKPSIQYSVVTICREDSQNITDAHRSKMADACQSCLQKFILITHGTDTLIETAQYLQKHKISKVIVLTGSFKPETFKDSDADFNIGFALGSLLTMSCGVYVAMNACICDANGVNKDDITGNFGRI